MIHQRMFTLLQSGELSFCCFESDQYVNLKQSCQCGVHVFNLFLYVSVICLSSFLVVLIQFSSEVSRFENDKRAPFLSCQRTPG